MAKEKMYGRSIARRANSVNKVNIPSFTQYIDRHRGCYTDVGKCDCGTICQIIFTKNNFAFLVNLSDNQKHRSWEDNNPLKFKCIMPAPQITNQRGHYKMVSKDIVKEQRRYDEVPIQKSTPDDFIIIDEQPVDQLLAKREQVKTEKRIW